ncbi:hypothetical protein HY449_03930 [Candidatus Pacearchaeota archaeon]|nr:hypothetical protein [Candidatus Pacearchaeota archaeon]
MDLETIFSNLANDYPPELMGPLAVFAIAEVAVAGLSLYGLAKWGYSNYRTRNSANKELTQKNSEDLHGRYSI